MRLVDLDPRWFDFAGTARAGFVFKCPCCPGGPTYLTCKRVPMQVIRDQYKLIDSIFPDIDCREWVPAKPDFSWSIGGEFGNLTVTPSIDASKSGHWHGFITNGEIK